MSEADHEAESSDWNRVRLWAHEHRFVSVCVCVCVWFVECFTSAKLCHIRPDDRLRAGQTGDTSRSLSSSPRRLSTSQRGRRLQPRGQTGCAQGNDPCLQIGGAPSKSLTSLACEEPPPAQRGLAPPALHSSQYGALPGRRATATFQGPDDAPHGALGRALAIHPALACFSLPLNSHPLLSCPTAEL